ncbi:MAG: PAS domain-containing sensor histidine kinase [Deltaproteobacteria bacterium]|nr:PAS domain-containing sensor histidine kinase [Deltaproteobacteria bacterium]
MAMPPLQTFFAPPERAPEENVIRDGQAIRNIPLLTELLDEVPSFLVILNPQRQIVYANRAMLKALGLKDGQGLVGQRPGEALSCVHSHKCSGGCGTSEFCQACGATQAFLESQEGDGSVKECRIMAQRGDVYESFDLEVAAKPFSFTGREFTLFVLTDISHVKRRRFLERIFFHDILNTAGGIRGFSQLIKDGEYADLTYLSEAIYEASNSLIGEIEGHRHILAAENSDLEIYPEKLDTYIFLEKIILVYSRMEEAKAKKICLDPQTSRADFVSDPVLLGRVIGNLVKNALEASLDDQEVTIGCLVTDQTIEFWVHNSTVMPRQVQLQVFNRSFSTKGSSRGLGTYSVKLLSERYLAGQVFFTSTPEEGTTFQVIYPRYLDKSVRR